MSIGACCLIGPGNNACPVNEGSLTAEAVRIADHRSLPERPERFSPQPREWYAVGQSDEAD